MTTDRRTRAASILTWLGQNITVMTGVIALLVYVAETGSVAVEAFLFLIVLQLIVANRYLSDIRAALARRDEETRDGR